MSIYERRFFSNHENYRIQTLCLLNKELIKESQEEDKKKEDQKDEEKDKKNEVKLNILEHQNGNKYAESLVTILDNIIKDLAKGIITKKDLEKFLNIKREKTTQKVETHEIKKEEKKNEKNKNENDKQKEENDPYVRDKLELLTLIISDYDPTIKYAEYKSSIEKINEKV